MLRMQSVHAKLGGFVILRDVSMVIDPGKTILLIGRNGAGKTTTLRTLMGHVPVESGAMTFDGADLLKLPAYARAGLGIGYAPEDRRLIARFTVEENLLLPMIAMKQPVRLQKERLEAVYELMPELAALRARSGGQLSGGQGKMVALGRALMVGTRIVLLDEPFQGLAPALAQKYADTLLRIRAQRKELAILITESSPKLIEKLSDSALRIERGHIAMVDAFTQTAGEVHGRQQHPG
jgi:ABC-type branched-subunit amino acid transport system ATPase component